MVASPFLSVVAPGRAPHGHGADRGVERKPKRPASRGRREPVLAGRAARTYLATIDRVLARPRVGMGHPDSRYAPMSADGGLRPADDATIWAYAEMGLQLDAAAGP